MPTRYVHTRTPISQQHPVAGLWSSAHMLLHMRWRVRAWLTSMFPCLLHTRTHAHTHTHTHTSPVVASLGLSIALCLTAYPSSPHTQYTPPHWMADQRTRPVNQVTLHLVGIGAAASIIKFQSDRHLLSFEQLMIIFFYNQLICYFTADAW